MNILMLAINDPAGTGIQFCKAVNRYSEHTCRIATLETRYTHSWEPDLHVPDLDIAGLEELGELFRNADILHFHMTCDEHQPFGPFLPADFMAGKIIVHHHHGHHDFRSNPQSFSAKYKKLGRRNLLVSTPDLLKKMPEAQWQPNLVPVNEPLFMPSKNREFHGGPLKVAHSPTRKDLKNTDEFLRVTEALKADGVTIDMDLIDDVPNTECLARKKECHVLFDHMQGYYGVSSLEGLSQGLAVLAGLDDWNRQCITEFAETEDLPWIVVRTEAELRAALQNFHSDRDACEDAGTTAREFMLNHWSDKKTALHLTRFWESAE